MTSPLDSISGMKAAGYQFINIDDGWEGSRDAAGHIRSNERFPDMKALADYVHGKGLKFGLYSDAGTGTCQKRPGSKDHEEVDARTYASWRASGWTSTPPRVALRSAWSQRRPNEGLCSAAEAFAFE